jgi:hypothetical protein
MFFTPENIKKFKMRSSLILTNSLNSISLPVINVLFSLAVIKIMGVDVYGNFVYYFLWATLASFVMNWGNRDYLLRQFSKQHPNPSLWRVIFTRFLLIFP